MLLGYATPEATERFAARFGQFRKAGFYRPVFGLHVSSVGMGTYLGKPDDDTSRAYCAAVERAVQGGINFIDTSLNYRHQRSEQAIGTALMRLKETARVDRDCLMVCTKAGFLVPGAVPTEKLRPEDIVDGSHSIAPGFLMDQLERSRHNLNLETIDVFYLHNVETQLDAVEPEVFEQRLRDAFVTLEKLASLGKIRYYGTATWEGYRKPGRLSLERLVSIAREVAGEDHRFRFVQAPYNLAMTELYAAGTQKLNDQPLSLLDAARQLGVTVVSSAALLQRKLLSRVPDALAESIPGLSRPAQQALQFARSAPGITTALVGMSQLEHVDENLAVAAVPPVPPEAYRAFFQNAA